MTGTDTEYVDAAWGQVEAIRHLYSRCAEKRPVMVLELSTGRIYAYPYQGFKADLSARSQALLKDEYAQAAQSGEMVVFVRDEERRKLVSFTLPVDDADGPGPNTVDAPDRGHGTVRNKRAASGRVRGG
jgi:hypothetical protein